MTFKQLILLQTLLILVPFAGCKRANPHQVGYGRVFTVETELQQYVHADIGKNGQGAARFFFPTLQIYDSSGALLYASHDSKQNVELLQSRPEDIQRSRVVAGSYSLVVASKGLTSLSDTVTQVSAAHHYVMLSIVLDDCHACSVQEEEFAASKTKFTSEGFDILTLVVRKPAGGEEK